MKNYNYIPAAAKIVKRKPLCEDVLMLRLKFRESNAFSFIPGQLVMISVLGFGEIPVGISSAPADAGFIEVAVRSAGMVTTKICSLAVGDTVGVNGPFGNGFPMAKIKGRDVIIIAGGIGLFPLRSLINHLGKNRKMVSSLTIAVGARCPERLIYRDEYKKWEKFAKVFATVDTCEKNWKGCTGNITKIYPKLKADKGTVVLVCGPPIMYKSVIEYFGSKVLPENLYFDLERRMKCGIGKCQHCTCGRLYTCLDGPTFSYDVLKGNPEAFREQRAETRSTK